MMRDAVATMGDVLPQDVRGRDAVHVAVISVVAGEDIAPGNNIRIHGHQNGEDVAFAGVDLVGDTDGFVGIADPFIKRGIRKGERFWLYLYPRSITSLNHQWTHPAFPEQNPQEFVVYTESYHPMDTADRQASEEWLRNFCAHSDCPSYETVMGAIKNSLETYDFDPDRIHFNGQDAHGTIPPEFWVHVERVLGERLPAKRPEYFSCSC